MNYTNPAWIRLTVFNSGYSPSTPSIRVIDGYEPCEFYKRAHVGRSAASAIFSGFDHLLQPFKRNARDIA